VNRYGKRFVDECTNYNDLPKAFNSFDPTSYKYPNLPCWIIFDAQFRKNYGCMTTLPRDPDPDWLAHDDTLVGLAKKVGIGPAGLEDTVKRFNAFAAIGVDEDFNRGGNIYDRYYGDREHDGPNPCLGTIEKPPFYALPVYMGAIGTKGGPKVNTRGQVLNLFCDVIPGLYAAGNVMASVAGPGYGGHGATLGLAMTWGYICGDNVVKEKAVGKTTATEKGSKAYVEKMPSAAPSSFSRLTSTLRQIFSRKSIQEIDYRTFIDAPINVVWEFGNELRNWAPFLKGFQGLEELNDNESIWTMKGDVGPLTRAVKFHVRITERVELERIAFELKGVNEPVAGAGSIRVETSGSGTMATVNLRASMEGPLGSIMNPFIAPMLKPMAEELMAKLKAAILENAKGSE